MEIRKSSDTISRMEKEARELKRYLYDRQFHHDEAEIDIPHVLKDKRAENWPYMDNLLKQKRQSEEEFESALPKWKILLAELEAERRRHRSLWAKLYPLTQEYCNACLATEFKSTWSCAPPECYQLRVSRETNSAIATGLAKIRELKREVLALKSQLLRARRRVRRGLSIWPFGNETSSQGADQGKLREELAAAEGRLARLQDELEFRRMRQGLIEPDILEKFRSILLKFEQQSTRNSSAHGAHDNHSEHSRASAHNSHWSSDDDSETEEEYRQRLVKTYKATQAEIEDLQNRVAQWHHHVRQEEIEYQITFPNATASHIENAILSTKQSVVDDLRGAENDLVVISEELAKQGVEVPRSRGVTPAVSEVTIPDDESVKKIPVRLKRRKLNRYRFASRPGHPSSRISERSLARFEGSSPRRMRSPSMSPSPSRKSSLAEHKRQQKLLRAARLRGDASGEVIVEED